MRDLLRAFSLGLLLTLLVAGTASADPILVTDHRFVAAAAEVNGGTNVFAQQIPSNPFAPFAGVATATAAGGDVTAQTTATQHSMFAPGAITASGAMESRASVPGDLLNSAQTSGSSTFEFEFDLTAPHRFALTGSMAVSDQIGGFGEVELALQNETLNEVVAGDDIRFGAHPFGFTGILPAGRHRLFAEASMELITDGGISSHTSNFDLDFALTPTPEPGSVLLLGAGLLVLGLTSLSSLIRGASPLGLPDTRSRAPLRRRAPIAWLGRCAPSLSH